MNLASFGVSLGLVTFLAGGVLASPLSLLHSFASGTNNQSNSNAGIATDGTILYGTTYGGGANGVGTIYRINSNGTDFHVVRSFAGEGADGANPYGNLLLRGNALYGTTDNGGQFNNGTIYAMNTDGSDFRLLHVFDGSSGDRPTTGLVASGNTFYGTTTRGGINDRGTVYRIEADGTGFETLHRFAGGTAGDTPTALIAVGSTLYGTTFSGGSDSRGSVFRIDADGTDFEIIHSFVGGEIDGHTPLGGLVTDGSALYGTTESGGINQAGTIFRLNFDGSGYQLLHRFYELTEGRDPRHLTIVGSQLFGTTDSGGAFNHGTLFALGTDGSGFRRVHSFGPGPDNGTPAMRIIVSEDSLYGTVQFGGANDGGGVYSLVLPATFAASEFNEPSPGSGNYQSGPLSEELGFITTQLSTGGANPLAAVVATTEGRTLAHRSVHATTRFDPIDISEWLGVEVSLDMQVSNSVFEAGDFIRIYVTDGIRFVDLFNRQATSANNDALDLLASRGFVNVSAAIPSEWTTVQLVIESSSNSTQGAERFDFDNVIISGAPVPVPEPSSLTLAALALAASIAGARRGVARSAGALLYSLMSRTVVFARRLLSNVLDRDFHVDAPNQKWSAASTSIPTRKGCHAHDASA